MAAAAATGPLVHLHAAINLVTAKGEDYCMHGSWHLMEPAGPHEPASKREILLMFIRYNNFL